MGARYYQPELGRWTQPDPSGLDANAYAYVGGDPINNIDPLGLFTSDGVVSAFFGGSIGVLVLGVTQMPVVAGAAAGCASFAASKAFEDQGADLKDIAFDCLVGAVPGAAVGALSKAAGVIRNFIVK
jgi:uncharacterized protein RhaS with RHS repeats